MKYFIAIVFVLFASFTQAAPRIENLVFVDESVECLALNIYYEARSDNLVGKYAVANVVLNRVKDPRYPNTVCGVVYQGRLGRPNEIIQRHKCQFSWYCDGLPDTPSENDSWQDAQIVAYNIIKHNKFRGITEGATHYHADYVSPKWAKDFVLIGTIGQHIFYRWDNE